MRTGRVVVVTGDDLVGAYVSLPSPDTSFITAQTVNPRQLMSTAARTCHGRRPEVTHMVPHFTPDAAALLLIDYQVGTLQLARTNPSDVALRNAITLAKAALAFQMPIVLTSSQEDRIQGRVDERLQRVVPDAYVNRVQRQGIVDAWKDRKFKAAIEATGRRQLIIGAITTDICLVFPSISAVQDGYEVQAVMDACGSPFPINEDIARERLKAGGVPMTVTNTMVAELVGDWSTPQGQELVKLLFAAAPMQEVD